MSGSDNNKGKKLENHQQALHSYLDALLQEVPDDLEEAPALQALSEAGSVRELLPYAEQEDSPLMASPVKLVTPVLQLPVVMPLVQREIEQPRLPEPELLLEPEQQTKIVVEAVEPVVDKAKPVTDRAESLIPSWAQERFQCLMFKVAGISLAVPLVKLNGVVNWSDKITPMPGHTSKFLGLLRRLDQNVKVIDTAQVVLPESMQASALAPAAERIHNILIMDEGEWGLGCDGIGEVITLVAADVRWRTTQGKRPWLAGTVTEHLCALLDTDTFARMLKEGEG